MSSEAHFGFRMVDCNRSSARKVRCRELASDEVYAFSLTSFAYLELVRSTSRTVTARRRVILVDLKSRSRVRSQRASEGTFVSRGSARLLRTSL